MTIRERIDEALEHFDYVLVKNQDHSFDNVLAVDNGTPLMIYRYLIIVYGADRVSKSSKGVKVLGVRNN